MTTVTAVSARQQLLAAIPATERKLDLAGISTSLLEGGVGPPLILLHGPGEFGGKWMHVFPDLVETHRVVAPDLPGHGESGVPEGELDEARLLRWLGDLIDATCAEPPIVVGHLIGGGIAAWLAAAQPGRIARLVLVNAFGLGKFRPAPSFALALMLHLARPTEHTFDRLWRRCALDLHGLRERMGPLWEAYARYAIERAQAPGSRSALHTLIDSVGTPPIPPADLERISIPVTLVWGRHDLGIRVKVAEAASARYGWPLRVIEGSGDDPALEQPEALLRALREAMS